LDGPADLILTGADIYTVDAARRWAKAIAIKGDRILALGSGDDPLHQLAGPSTERMDLTGRMIVPGFQDAHVHAPFAGRYMLGLSLHGIQGLDAYKEAIASYAGEHPELPWIFGGGWAMDTFPGGLPDRRDLDQVVSDRPVFLMNRDVHGAWVNTKALELAGIDRDTPDPPDGRIERDASGEPTGALHEGAAYSFQDRFVPAPTDEQWRDAIAEAQRYLHSLGITGWQDAWVTPETLRAYRQMDSAGSLTARVVTALWWDRHCGPEQIDDLVEQRGEPGPGDRNLQVTTVKIMVDGVLENFTGALLDPYLGPDGSPTSNKGLTYVDAEPLAVAVTRLDALGFQVHMHAIGDRAVRIALDAVEAAREANEPDDRRHHIAHLQVVQPEDIPRFRALGVTANCQPYWAQHDAQVDRLTVPFLGPERAALQYPFGSLAKAGAVIAFGSDWSVSTPDPLELIEVAVRRADPAARDAEPLLPDQALTLPQALTAATAGSAYVDHDDEAGWLAPGKRADLAVLDRNIFQDPNIADATVEMTMASGRFVHGG
jgi:predicted amidohydrolase YtcJ